MQWSGYGIVPVAVESTDGPQQQRMEQGEEKAMDGAGHSHRGPVVIEKPWIRESQEDNSEKYVHSAQMEKEDAVRCRWLKI